MAITKIWKVASRLDTSVRYIINPDKTTLSLDMETASDVEKYITNPGKTESALYVRAYNCGKEKACERMLETQARFGKQRRKGRVLAYHLVQSFKDFEATPTIAHKCGRELVERLLADNYEVVLATHLDHDHLHNHILFNAVSFKTGKKYRNNFKDYFIDIRGISDEICRENCLSVITNPKMRGMHYAEWDAQRKGKPTIRGQVRSELDEIIKSSYTMRDFWKNLEERGYVINRKGVNITHVSFTPPFGKRPIRFTNLGEGYTLEDIQERIIAARNGIRTAAPSELSKKVYRKGTAKPFKTKKLKGFMALYFHYLYLFKIIQKKKTPQRVSFFMRDELTKLERYQKQFKFLYKNEIGTVTELDEYQRKTEERIADLTNQRQALYKSKNEEAKENISEINKEISALHKDVRMCKSIFADVKRIAQKKQQADLLQIQAKEEVMQNEHKRRSRGFNG